MNLTLMRKTVKQVQSKKRRRKHGDVVVLFFWNCCVLAYPSKQNRSLTPILKQLETSERKTGQEFLVSESPCLMPSRKHDRHDENDNRGAVRSDAFVRWREQTGIKPCSSP